MSICRTVILPAAALLAAVTTTVPGAAQERYDRIVVFGTSLSDSGNAFALRGGTATPHDYKLDPLLVPSVPFARGGHHFSNGATWVEQFARGMGLAGTVRPAFRSRSTNATNYAVGAARAYEDGKNFNLAQQVNAFLEDYGGVAPSGALYVIEMGGNDIRDALVAYSSGMNGGPILQAANVAIMQSILDLYQARARNFLVWRAPDIGLTPAVSQLGPQAVRLATQLAFAFNAGLDSVVSSLSGLPDISFARLDATRLIGNLVAHPAAFGLTNVTRTCITPDEPPFACQNPDEFLFWDGIHPTKAVHGIVAQEALAVLMN